MCVRCMSTFSSLILCTVLSWRLVHPAECLRHTSTVVLTLARSATRSSASVSGEESDSTDATEADVCPALAADCDATGSAFMGTAAREIVAEVFCTVAGSELIGCGLLCPEGEVVALVILPTISICQRCCRVMRCEVCGYVSFVCA